MKFVDNKSRPIPSYVSLMFALSAGMSIPLLITNFEMVRLTLVLTQLLVLGLIREYNKVVAP